MMLSKKIIFSILAILIIFTSSTAFASAPLKDVIDKQSVNFSDEKNTILNAQINSKMKPKDIVFDNQKENLVLKQKNQQIKNKNDITYGNMFKEYYLVPPLKDDIYNQLLNSNYAWKFPIYKNDTAGSKLSVSSALIDKTSDENYWHLVLVNTNSSPEVCDILSDSNKLTKVLNKNGISSADNLLTFMLLEQDFVYVSTNGNNYIIPMFSYGDSRFGMKTMTKYTVNEFKDDVTSYINSLQPETGGLPRNVNSAHAADKSNTAYIYYIAGALLVIFFILFIYKKKFQSSRINK